MTLLWSCGAGAGAGTQSQQQTRADVNMCKRTNTGIRQTPNGRNCAVRANCENITKNATNCENKQLLPYCEMNI